MVEELDTCAKAGDRNSFVVAVHAQQVGFGQREGQQAVGLHVVEAQLGGVGGAGGKEGHDDGAGKLLRRETLDGLVETPCVIEEGGACPCRSPAAS